MADFHALDPRSQLRLLESEPARPEWLRHDLAPAVLVALLEHLPAPLHDHPSPQVRAASARYAQNPGELLSREDEPLVQAALLKRVEDPAVVLEYLGSPDWSVRNAASRAAVRLELRGPLRNLALLSRHQGIKFACVQALRELGEHVWLAENYL